jgi:hypothetical protein
VDPIDPPDGLRHDPKVKAEERLQKKDDIPAKPVVSPSPDELDPLEHLVKLIRAAVDKVRAAAHEVRKALSFIPAAIYFWGYWPLKEFGRQWLRVGAISFLSLSFIVLLAEIAIEMTGSKRLAGVMHDLEDPAVRVGTQALFVVSALVMLAHHWKEVRHTKSQHVFASALWAILESRGSRDERQFIATALSLANKVFAGFSVAHVCLWQPNMTRGGLEIFLGCASPDDDQLTLRFLAFDTGIACQVYKDSLIRYVPRFGFPFNSGPFARLSLRFPHALSFKTSKSVDSMPEVDRPTLLMDKTVLEDAWWEGPVRAFVVVPLKTSSDLCVGAMSIDFSRTDPLDREQMKIAASLAMLIAEELTRLRGQPSPVS